MLDELDYPNGNHKFTQVYDVQKKKGTAHAKHNRPQAALAAIHV